MVRLPIPQSDDGTWGDILNEFLEVEHNSDGTLKSGGSLASKADDTAVVHDTGDETIAGIKTFSSGPVVPDGSFSESKVTNLTSDLAGKQPLDSDLTAIAALSTTSYGRSLLELADAVAARTAIGAQQSDAELTAIAGLTSAADKLPYFTGSGTASLADLTSAGRALIDDTDANAQRATLSVYSITQVDFGLSTKQNGSTSLTAIQSLTPAADKLPYFTSSSAAALADLSTYIRTLLDDTTAAAARNTLGAAGSDQGQPGMYAPSATYVSTQSGALTASTAYLARFVPSRDMMVTLIAFVVTTAAGSNDNCDVGIYTVSGANFSRLASAGATASKLNSQGVKTVSLSASLTAGTIYYVAFSCGTFGGTAASLQMANLGILGGSELFGNAAGKIEVGSKASSHPLPSSITGALSQAALVPLMAVRES